MSVDSTVVLQGDRAGLCRGIDSQNSHGSSWCFFNKKARIIPYSVTNYLEDGIDENEPHGQCHGARRGRQTGEKRRPWGRITSDCHKSPKPRECRRRESSRPTPCLRVITASGSCTSSNGSPPRKRQSSMRAFNSGSSGEVNGNLSIITNDNAIATHVHPFPETIGCHKKRVTGVTNCCNSCPLLVSPATKREASW